MAVLATAALRLPPRSMASAKAIGAPGARDLGRLAAILWPGGSPGFAVCNFPGLEVGWERAASAAVAYFGDELCQRVVAVGQRLDGDDGLAKEVTERG
jgi:hypothetical protein